jgi:hypothetical protein
MLLGRSSGQLPARAFPQTTEKKLAGALLVEMVQAKLGASPATRAAAVTTKASLKEHAQVPLQDCQDSEMQVTTVDLFCAFLLATSQ